MPALASDLMNVGLPSEQSIRLGTDALATCTTAGTTQGAATAITSRLSKLVTAASQTGALLPSTAEIGQPYFGFNSTSTTGVLYPHSGGNINGGTNNAGVNIAQGKAFQAMLVNSSTWLVIVSA